MDTRDQVWAADNLQFRRLEINGGRVQPGRTWQFYLPPTDQGYVDAQIDDYGRQGNRRGRRHYPWQPGVTLHLRARFSHPAGALLGTAGFGFWNAPIGDPTLPWPALPQAVWFFHASAPTDLPLNPHGPGRGWFASTIDATTPSALAMAPLAPFVLLLNQFPPIRRRVWPAVQRRLGISYTPLSNDITQWHDYNLSWQPQACTFSINGTTVLHTNHSPRGPLGFVCWLDNQYLIVTSRGRLGWGVLPTQAAQWLEIADLRLARNP